MCSCRSSPFGGCPPIRQSHGMLCKQFLAIEIVGEIYEILIIQHLGHEPIQNAGKIGFRLRDLLLHFLHSLGLLDLGGSASKVLLQRCALGLVQHLVYVISSLAVTPCVICFESSSQSDAFRNLNCYRKFIIQLTKIQQELTLPATGTFRFLIKML